MTSKEDESGEHVETDWVRHFMKLFLIGFFMILVGVMITVVAALLFGEGVGSFGGFILIGPFPFVFGAGPEAPWLALFAVILGILSITLSFLLWRRRS
ncbi:MAG: DUF131 domain-containing protein [Candidatus Bathyarchaeia archaeon]